MVRVNNANLKESEIFGDNFGQKTKGTVMRVSNFQKLICVKLLNWST